MPDINQRYNYDIEFIGGGADLKDNLTSFELSQNLDQPAICSVKLAFSLQDISDQSVNNMPVKLKFLWAEKKLFIGHLISMDMEGDNVVVLQFADSLYGERNKSVDSFVETTNLKETIDELLKKSPLEGKFISSFTDSVDHFYINGDSVLQSISNLSYTYGFYFFCRGEENEVKFIRTNDKIDEYQIDCNGDVNISSAHLDSDEIVKNLSISYFDYKKLESEDVDIEYSSFIQMLDGLGKSPNISARSDWFSGQGDLQVNCKNNKGFSEFQNNIKACIGKRMVGQEYVIVEGFDFFGMPGDWVKLKNSSLTNFIDGSFLVSEIKIIVQSSTPEVLMKLVRA